MSVMLVSIGITSFNHAEYLPEAIESCLNQTYKNIEIVIVDDNSSDNSLEIARQYERDYPSIIRVFTHPDNLNHGISASVNLYVSKFRGQFYSALASDDVFYPEKTEKQVTYLVEHPDVGWVYSKARWFGARSQVVGDTDLSQDPNALETLIRANRIWGITVMSRKEVWDRTGLHAEELVYSDWDFWVRMLAISKVGFINEVLAGARIHSGNASVGNDVKAYLRYNVEVMTALLKRPFEPRLQELINAKRSEYLLELSRLG
jgi:glycosyltransferase involved in cell wall biosynthesis